MQACLPRWFQSLARVESSGFRHADYVRCTKQALIKGVSFDLTGEPLHVQLDNTPAVTKHMPMCLERAKYYMDIAALEILETKPDIVQPLHVVTKTGRKPRLVLDLSRNLNDLLDHDSFKPQRFQDAVDASTPGCFYGKMDLSDCFLSFPVSENARRFLSFELGGQYYRFRRLPFGLSSAPLWCHRFMEVIDCELTRLGVRFVRYTDDFLLIGESRAAVRAAMRTTRSVLEEHGLRINDKKTEGPTQVITFLGLGLNSLTQTIHVPADKVAELKSIIGSTIRKERVSKWQLQSLVGKFSFAATALPGARPFFRSLIDATRGLGSRFATTLLSEEVVGDLRAWMYFLKEWKGSARWVAGEEVVISHDASGGEHGGFGFALSSLPENFDVTSLPELLRPGNVFAGTFDDASHAAEVKRSIQYGELFAVAISVALHAPYLSNKALLVETDNLADVHIINRQSTKSPELLALLREIYATCAHYNIALRAKHIPGKLNVLPDFLSRAEKHWGRVRVPKHLPHANASIHHVLSSSLQLRRERSMTPAACSIF